MFDPNKFNEELFGIYGDIISNLLSFLPDKDMVEKAYYIGEMEGGFEGSVLYQMDGKVLTSHDSFMLIGFSEAEYKDKYLAILRFLNKELKKIKALFEDTGQEYPKCIRLIYDVQKGSLETELSYDPLTTEEFGMHDALMAWRDELNAALESQG